jgi:large subunit ribosomal protein L4
MKHDVVNLKNKVVGSVELPEAVFADRVNEALVLQVIKAQLAGLRQGTAKNKCKAEVRGGGKKPFKQKGTGNARQGSSRSPLNPGGGSSFGPQPRSYKQATPKKMVQGAVRSVLSDKVAAKRLIVIDDINLTGKTKELVSVLTKDFNVKSALIVDAKNENLLRASRNIPTVRFLTTDNVSPYELVKHEWLLCSKKAVEALASKFSS